MKHGQILDGARKKTKVDYGNQESISRILNTTLPHFRREKKQWQSIIHFKFPRQISQGKNLNDLFFADFSESCKFCLYF